MQKLTGTRLGVVTTNFLHANVHRSHRLPIFGSHCIGFSLEHCGNFGIATQDEIQRRVRQRRGFLRHAGNAYFAWQFHVPFVCLQLALDRCK